MEQHGLTSLLLLFVVGSVGAIQGQKEPMKDVLAVPRPEDYDVGDPRRCLEQARKNGFSTKRFEVLPGIGWDNLRNVEAGQVVIYNYSKCLNTDDGHFLIPDNVFSIPVKSSYVEMNSEFYDTWHNTSSTTSNGINVNAGGGFGIFAASGSFSKEHTQIKSKQIEDKASTTRVQLRYNRYEARLQPDPVLHPTFKSRLLDIASLLELNMTDSARYAAQLIVRDFGTHIVTGVMAGGTLVKTDFLSRQYIATQFKDRTKLTASASASFASFFHMSAQYTSSTEKVDTTSYEKGVTHSYVTSHGGPIMKAFNMTTNQWTDGMDDDLVPIDRSGDPIYYLVNKHTMSELPPHLIDEVEDVITRAVENYYEMNTIRGCTKMGSPNFSFDANFDDGSCEAEATNMTFGGVFQTCQVRGEVFSSSPCTGLSQVNPKTRAYNCPPSYTAVLLNTGEKRSNTQSRRSCHSCGFLGLFHCCHTDLSNPVAVYKTYWCAALGPVSQDSGYLFGGIYSSKENNPATGTKGCPPKYYPRLMLYDHDICISDDFELGASYSLPFGGFSSCNMGNPLALPGIHPVGVDQEKTPRPNTLEEFLTVGANAGPASWPKKCPQGYSEHLVAIDTGCEIRYCLKTGSLSGPNLPPIKRPPFMHKPPSGNDVQSYLMFREDTQEWQKNYNLYQQANFQPSTSIHGEADPHTADGSGMSSGAVAGVSVLTTLAAVGLATLISVMVYKRIVSKRGTAYRGLNEEVPVARSATYGSTEQPGDTSVNIHT